MSRYAMPEIPEDMNAIVFRAKSGEMGLLMRPGTPLAQLTAAYSKLFEMLMDIEEPNLETGNY